MNIAAPEITLRLPTADDGLRLHQLVAECPPLDANSVYCNLLQCTHFAPTSVVAEQDGHLVGSVSGYLLPDDLQTLFVWQVAVAPIARKRGLALRMLMAILQRPSCANVKFVHTTVTPANGASRALFTALSHDLHAPLTENVWFASERHFSGAHADEILLGIGPFTRGDLLNSAAR